VLLVGLFVAFGELQENDLFLRLIDIVEHTVGSDAHTIFSGEVGDDELTRELLHTLAFGLWIRRERSDGIDDGFSVVGGNLGERSLKLALDPFTGEDQLVRQLESHLLEESFSGHRFPLRILGPCTLDFPE
jgi:hypothetical protein